MNIVIDPDEFELLRRNLPNGTTKERFERAIKLDSKSGSTSDSYAVEFMPEDEAVIIATAEQCCRGSLSEIKKAIRVAKT